MLKDDRTAPTHPRLEGDDTSRQGPAPKKLGRYQVLGLLGHGGMGIVYAAFDEQLRRRVAIKEIDRSGEDPRRRRRARREAQALARVTHPNIVAVHEVLELDARLCIVMEHVAGQTLRQWLHHQRPARSELLSVLVQAGRGIAAAHAAGLVHRDLKPDNIMVGDDGRVRVMDFGLAHVMDELEPPALERAETEPIAARIEASLHTNSFLGTPGYAAPEQQLGLEADLRSDVFGFCVVAFEALHGRRPFPLTPGASPRSSVLDGRLADPAGDGVPAWLDAVIRRGLALEPDARWSSMDELLEALAKDPVARRRRRLGLALAVAAMLAVTVLLANRISRWREAQEHERAEAAALDRLSAVEQSIRDAEAVGDGATAEGAFRAFVSAPENRGTRALARAWLGRGDRKRDQPEVAIAAYAEAYVSARALEEERAALRSLAGMFLEQWNGAALGRSVALWRASGGDDRVLDEHAFQAALWQRDLAAALAELERPEHPRASWRPLLESMARSRSRPVLVDALTVLPPGGPARVVVRGHEPGEVVLLDDQLVEVDRLDLDQQLRLVPGLPWAVAEDDEHAVLLDLLHGRTLGVGRPQLHHLAPFDVTGDGEPELLLTRKWPEYGFWRWDLEGGRLHERNAYEPIDASGTTFEAHVVGDLDEDGVDEIVIGFAEWSMFEIVVLRPDPWGELELVARHHLGRPGSMTIVRRGGHPLLAVLNDRLIEAPEIFPEPPHTGKPPGVRLLALERDALVERETYLLPHADAFGHFRAGHGAIAGDLDGDGLEDLAFPLVRAQLPWVLVLRQTAAGFELLPIAGVSLLGGAQLDDDPPLELLVRASPELELVVLGLGDEPVPPLHDPALESLPTPALVSDPALAERWRRADDLAQLELPRAAAASLSEGALLTNDRATKSVLLDRAAELLVRDERPRELLELELDVHDDPDVRARALARRTWALSRLGRYEEALATARELERTPGRDDDGRARVDELSAMLDPAVALDLDLDRPLSEQWRLPTPGAVYRNPAGWLELSVPATSRPVAELPIEWDGRPIAFELELRIDRLEFGACMEIELVDESDQPWLGASICGEGGGERLHRTTYVHAGPRASWAAVARHESESALSPGELALQLAYFPDRRQTEIVVDDGRADGPVLAAKLVDVAPPAGRHRLVIRSLDSPEPNLALVRIERLRLRGATAATLEPEQRAQARPARLLAEGEPRAALEALGQLASPPEQAELLRLLALA
ncbi:MAG: serine/threonine protein kinase, partial [Myxococcales bacterium]|nr:serine/threonine protein kinase [Myxococcales bacterium]